MSTIIGNIQRCDRCHHKELPDQNGKEWKMKVVICAHVEGGRRIELCKACHDDVLAFCEGFDGPYAEIKFDPDRNSRYRADWHNQL